MDLELAILGKHPECSVHHREYHGKDGTDIAMYEFHTYRSLTPFSQKIALGHVHSETIINIFITRIRTF